MKHRPYLFLLLWLGLTVIAYLPSLRGEFISDEYLLILRNPRVQHPQGLKSLLMDKFWTGKARGIYYRPVIILSYALNWRLSGKNTMSYHLLNLGFYLGTIVLFFLLARRWLPAAALLSTAFFALHPAHTESVAWIPGRTDTMAGFFILLAWLLWEKAAASRFPLQIVIYITIFCCLLLGLFCKEIAVLAPGLFLVSDFWQRPQGQGMRALFKSRLAGYLLVLLALLVYFWLRQQALSGPGFEPARPFLEGVPAWKKPFLVSRLFTEYLWVLIFPHPLRSDAYYAQKFASGNYPLWPSLASGVFWASALAMLLFGLIRRHYLAVLGLLFLMSLLPVSHLIPLPNSMAVRFLFLPSVFFALAQGAVLMQLWKKFPRAVSALAALLAACLFFLTLSANLHYRERYSCLRNLVWAVPEGAVVHNQLGLAALDRGWLSRAEKQFNWALELKPSYTEAMVNLSLVKLREGDESSALSLLNRAISTSPDYADAYYDLGLVLKGTGRFKEAAVNFARASELEPPHPGPLFELASIEFSAGELAASKIHAEAALQAADWHLPSLKLRLKIALLEKDYSQAKLLWKRGRELSPGDPELARLGESLPP